MKKINTAIYFLSLFVVILHLSCGSGDKNVNIRNASAGKSIIETGTLEAINNQQFILPRYSRFWSEMRVIGILEHGALVNEGDSILQMDPSEVNRLILERELNLETQLANLEKLQVQHNNQINELESKIRSETSSYNLKIIELEAARFETERHRTIKQLEYRQAEISLAKEMRKLELAKVIIDNDLKIQDVRIQQIITELESFERIIPMLTIRTPVSGVFQRGRNMRTGTMLNAGDMAIPNYSMGNVPQLQWMRVNTFVNESDFLNLFNGQKVIVRLDALPEIAFNGEVHQIGRLCRPRENNSRQKGFDVEVRMLTPDERLKPGMTVSCEFIQK